MKNLVLVNNPSLFVSYNSNEECFRYHVKGVEFYKAGTFNNLPKEVQTFILGKKSQRKLFKGCAARRWPMPQLRTTRWFHEIIQNPTTQDLDHIGRESVSSKLLAAASQVNTTKDLKAGIALCDIYIKYIPSFLEKIDGVFQIQLDSDHNIVARWGMVRVPNPNYFINLKKEYEVKLQKMLSI